MATGVDIQMKCQCEQLALKTESEKRHLNQCEQCLKRQDKTTTKEMEPQHNFKTVTHQFATSDPALGLQNSSWPIRGSPYHSVPRLQTSFSACRKKNTSS